MHRFIDGEDRMQQTLLPHSLEDYVGEENPVWVIEVFIDELDLAALGFVGMTPAATGRPAYHPSTLLKIYLYGYLNRVPSSERDYARDLPPIELVPQDITRVCLNLFGNGFYATTKRQREGGDPKFKPTLKVSTRDLGDAVELRAWDNGIGIPPDIKDKLFQPFFTTKPTAEGTGLGLSISYDIVTQQHGGTIEVDSGVGVFTEFTVPPATSIANQTRTRIQRIEPDHGWDHMPMLIHILLPKWNNPTGH